MCKYNLCKYSLRANGKSVPVEIYGQEVCPTLYILSRVEELIGQHIELYKEEN